MNTEVTRINFDFSFLSKKWQSLKVRSKMVKRFVGAVGSSDLREVQFLSSFCKPCFSCILRPLSVLIFSIFALSCSLGWGQMPSGPQTRDDEMIVQCPRELNPKESKGLMRSYGMVVSGGLASLSFVVSIRQFQELKQNQVWIHEIRKGSHHYGAYKLADQNGNQSEAKKHKLEFENSLKTLRKMGHHFSNQDKYAHLELRRQLEIKLQTERGLKRSTLAYGGIAAIAGVLFLYELLDTEGVQDPSDSLLDREGQALDCLGQVLD